MTDDLSKWSAMNVWFHPRKASDAIHDAEVDMEYMSARLDEASATIENLQRVNTDLMARCDSLQEELTRKDEKLACKDKELAQLESKLKESLSQLREQEEMEAELKEIDAMLTKVGEMKRRYETRISRLELQLRDLESRNRRLVASDLVEPTDLIDPSNPESMPRISDDSESRAPIDMKTRNSDVYLNVLTPAVSVSPETYGKEEKGKEEVLPEKKVVQPGRMKNASKKVKGIDIPEINGSSRREVPGNDWLLDLPDV